MQQNCVPAPVTCAIAQPPSRAACSSSSRSTAEPRHAGSRWPARRAAEQRLAAATAAVCRPVVHARVVGDLERGPAAGPQHAPHLADVAERDLRVGDVLEDDVGDDGVHAGRRRSAAASCRRPWCQVTLSRCALSSRARASISAETSMRVHVVATRRASARVEAPDAAADVERPRQRPQPATPQLVEHLVERASRPPPRRTARRRAPCRPGGCRRRRRRPRARARPRTRAIRSPRPRVQRYRPRRSGRYGAPVPRVSVIVPARDAAATLPALLAALAGAGRVRAYEVIVVDDGSSDATRGAGARHRGGDDRGRRAERRWARRRAQRGGGRGDRGDVLAFTDADCEPAAGLAARRPSPRSTPAPTSSRAPSIPAGVRRAVRPHRVARAAQPPCTRPRTSWCARARVRRASAASSRWLMPERSKELGEDVWLGWRLRARRRAGRRSAPEALVHHAVFPRDASGFVAERARLRYFPAIARADPRAARRRFFYRRVFLTRAVRCASTPRWRARRRRAAAALARCSLAAVCPTPRSSARGPRLGRVGPRSRRRASRPTRWAAAALVARQRPRAQPGSLTVTRAAAGCRFHRWPRPTRVARSASADTFALNATDRAQADAGHRQPVRDDGRDRLKQPRRLRAAGPLRGHGGRHPGAATTRPSSAARRPSEGYDVVVAFGGDGTVNEAANGLAGLRRRR